MGQGGTGGANTGGAAGNNGGSGGIGPPGGEVTMAVALAGGGEIAPRALAVEATGNIVLAAEIWGDLGLDSVVSAGVNDAAIVTFDASGTALSGMHLGDSAPQTVKAMALDAEGNRYIVGDFSGALAGTFGIVQSEGGRDGYLAKVAPNGTVLWVSTTGGAGQASCDGVAMSESGNILATGTFTGSVFQQGLTSQGAEDVFLASFDAEGSFVLAAGFGSPLSERAKAIAATGNDVVLAAEVEGDLLLAGADLPSFGGKDIFIARFANDMFELARRWGTAGDESPTGLTFAPDGSLIVASSVSGALDVGLGAVAGKSVVFGLNNLGEATWIRSLDGESVVVKSVSIDAANRVVCAGEYTGTLTLGGATAPAPTGTLGAFVASIEEGGSVRWLRSFSSDGSMSADAIWGGTDVLIAGSFSGTASVGGEMWTASGGSDLWMVKVTP